MNKNEKPWLETNEAKERLRKRFDEHRSKSILTCPEQCWCWEVDVLLDAMDYEAAWHKQNATGWPISQ